MAKVSTFPEMNKKMLETMWSGRIEGAASLMALLKVAADHFASTGLPQSADLLRQRANALESDFGAAMTELVDHLFPEKGE